VHTALWCRNRRDRDHLEDIRVDRTIILKLIFKKWYGLHGLIQDMDRLQAVVNAVMNLRVPYISLSAADRLTSKDGLCPVQFSTSVNTFPNTLAQILP
jgi:hypothetical protein